MSKATANAAPKAGECITTLLDRAQSGDKTVLPALRQVLKNPAAVDLLGGDLARQAQYALVNSFSGPNLAFRETIPCKLELLRAELAGSNPTALERLLVDRIVSNWLHLAVLEANYAGKESMSLELGTYFQKCLTAAQKRYLSAIKTLAMVRKLAVPVLQVNIARKQVNVAGDGTAVASVG